MENQGLKLASVLCALIATACTTTEPNDDLAFRMWGAGDNYAGNGDIEVHAGSDSDTDDTILWDIDGGSDNCVSRQVEPGVFEPRLNLIDMEIRQSSNVPNQAATCTMVEGEHPSGNEWLLLDAQGQVLFTLWKRYVFAGEVDLPNKPKVKQDPDLQASIALSFKKDKIYAGAFWNGYVLATASERIARSTPERRLLLSALVAGECGSDGLP